MSAALTLWSKQMLKLRVHPEEAVGMLIQPILWVVLFGIGMKGLLGPAIAGGGDIYITFMVPGIVALTAMSGAIGGGLVWLTERIQGIVKEYLAAPIPRLSILLGNALSIVTKTLFQAIVILVIGVLIGAQGNLDPLGWLGGLVLVMAYGLGFAGIALAFASKTDNPGSYHMVIFLLTLPLLFISNALYPLESMPKWMEICARLNPTSYVVDGMRQTFLDSSVTLAGAEFLPLWLCFIVVVAFAAFGMLLAYVAFQRAIR
jgi:ABC-2 type transport system permease protein